MTKMGGTRPSRLSILKQIQFSMTLSPVPNWYQHLLRGIIAKIERSFFEPHSSLFYDLVAVQLPFIKKKK
jgi:hypothetical protein